MNFKQINFKNCFLERIYEDHEFVVENIEDWLADSKNKLHFVRRSDKYDFIYQPQHYLLSEKSDFDLPPADSSEWNCELKQRLLKKFVESSQVPELDGHLYLKQDGKKSWRKYYFVLRSSGLYYCPKSKYRGTKDLQCLMNVYNNQIYTCIDWKKKYKAPTPYGFAIKHPKIQVKTSKYIKYVCTDDEKSYIKWLTALRLTRVRFKKCKAQVNSFPFRIAVMFFMITIPMPRSKPPRLPLQSRWKFLGLRNSL